jgi:hypothetical protein
MFVTNTAVPVENEGLGCAGHAQVNHKTGIGVKNDRRGWITLSMISAGALPTMVQMRPRYRTYSWGFISSLVSSSVRKNQ